MPNIPDPYVREDGQQINQSLLADKDVQTHFSTSQSLEPPRELIRALAVADTNASFYPPTHPMAKKAIEELLLALRAVTVLGFDDVTLSIYKKTFFVENQMFAEESKTHQRLIDNFLRRGISAATFSPKMVFNDALGLIELLNNNSITDIEMSRAFLEEHKVEAISISEVTMFDNEEDEELHEMYRTEAHRAYNIGISVMRDVESRVRFGQEIETAPLQQVVETLATVMSQDPGAVLGLTTIKSYDDYSLNHALNVSILAMSLGNVLKLDEETLNSLALSGLLYDIGKSNIPEKVLLKTGPLEPEEWAMIKSHSQTGANLLKSLDLRDMMPMVVAYEHHLRYDMSGYPESAESKDQHLFSGIVALCDAYDAMTTMLPFRRELQPQMALAILFRDQDKAFNPLVVKVFISMLGIYPIGAIVLLNDKSTGIVHRINGSAPLQPKLKIIKDSAGRSLEEPVVLDLSLANSDGGQPQLFIVKCISPIDAGVDDAWEYL